MTTSSSQSGFDSAQLRPTGQMPVSSGAADHSHAAGRDVNITWWYTFASIAGMSIFLLGLGALVCVSLIASLNGASWQTVVVLALFICSGVSSVYASWLIRDGYGAGWPSRTVSSWLLSPPVFTWALTLFIPGATLYGAAPLWITISIMLALVARGHRLPLVAIGLALIALHGALNPGTQAFLEAGQFIYLSMLVVLTPPTFLFSGWLWHLITRLDEARTVNSQLAVARERLRFASDLHDIQGHHLQVIALKAELADRLLTSDTPAHQGQAKQAIGEVRTLAEQAQYETRQLVRDLRIVSLNEELDNAKGVLEAAGIATQVTVDGDLVETSSRDSNRLLGFAVREATTNILRHAQAQHVTITLVTDEEFHLAIQNDGVAASSDHSTQHEGTGLAGLRQRFATVGGQLNTVYDQDTYRLEATLPTPAKDNHS